MSEPSPQPELRAANITTGKEDHYHPLEQDQDNESNIRKRQRASLVCGYCKKRKIKCDRQRPRCSACLKYSRECIYNISWFTESSDPTVPLAATITSFSSEASREMAAEIQLLKEKLIQLEKRQFSPNSSSQSSPFNDRLEKAGKSNTAPHPHAPPAQQNSSDMDLSKFSNYIDDTIDFYENYNSLAIKNSSHEDSKPLNHFAFYKKDHYYAFFTFFFFFYLHISRKVMEDIFKEDWKTKHLDGSSKWLVLISKDPEDEQLRIFGQKISKDRVIAKNMSPFPFSHSSDNSSQELKDEILRILPTKKVINGYVDLFFEHIWPVRPFVDESVFRKDILRIIHYNENGDIQLRLSKRSDMASISTLLIILRYGYVALSVMNSDPVLNYISLLENPIPVNFISVATLCLSFYKILKKTTLPMLQSMVLLRYYYRDAPEDSDGLSLIQAQQLMGFIIESALNMGLNRDPTVFLQFKGDHKMTDLRRRLWFGITRIETFSVISNGAIVNLPDDEAIDVKLPLLDKYDPLDVAQFEEYQKSQRLEGIYIKISKLVNNVHKRANIAELLKLISDASEHIDLNYRLQDNDPYLKLSNTTRSSKLCSSIGFSNTMSLSKMILHKNLEMQIYGLLSIHYETTKYSDQMKYFDSLTKQLEVSRESLDLSLALVLGKFKNKVPDICSFEVNTSVAFSLFRVITMFLSLCLQLYHSQELLEVPSYSKISSLSPTDLDPLIDTILQQCDYAIHILRETLGLKYWCALKAVCSFKYRSMIMRKHKFTFMSNIIDFLDKDTIPEELMDSNVDSSNVKSNIRDKLLSCEKGVADIIKQWIRIDISNVSSPDIPKTGTTKKDLIFNINHTNHFVSISREQLNRIYQLVNVDFKYIPEFKQMMTLYALQNVGNVRKSDPITSAIYESTGNDFTTGLLDSNPVSSQSNEPLLSGLNAGTATTTSTSMDDIFDPANFDFNFLDMFQDNGELMFKSLFLGEEEN